mgnify:CR=1 FL=1
MLDAVRTPWPLMVFTATVYLFWNLAAGTFGVFSPYILRTLGTQSQAASVALSCAGFVLTVLGVVLVFMPFSDRSHRSRRIMWGVGIHENIITASLMAVSGQTASSKVSLVTRRSGCVTR